MFPLAGDMLHKDRPEEQQPIYEISSWRGWRDRGRSHCTANEGRAVPTDGRHETTPSRVGVAQAEEMAEGRHGGGSHLSVGFTLAHLLVVSKP